MNMPQRTSQKVTASHLKRQAYCYVRQSTLKQVFENTESTKRQYALRERAVALGWPVVQIVTVDSDLGETATSVADRQGFQKLMTEVSLGRVGLVMGLEVSRLARNNADWARLLEICAITDTLILDEEGIYNPTDFNDRLLLNMKGTFSEVELHVLRSRLRGGILSKARRGELKTRLPTGLVYDHDDKIILDPDKQVQQSIRLFFDIFQRTGAAFATVKAFAKDDVKFPCRIHLGPDKGQLTPTLQKPRMLQIQGVRGCSCSVLPQALGNVGYAGYSAFPQGKKPANFIKILEFTRGRFQIFKSNFSEAVRLLSFMPLWHVFYATLGFTNSCLLPSLINHLIKPSFFNR